MAITIQSSLQFLWYQAISFRQMVDQFHSKDPKIVQNKNIQKTRQIKKWTRPLVVIQGQKSKKNQLFRLSNSFIGLHLSGKEIIIIKIYTIFGRFHEIFYNRKRSKNGKNMYLLTYVGLWNKISLFTSATCWTMWMKMKNRKSTVSRRKFWFLSHHQNRNSREIYFFTIIRKTHRQISIIPQLQKIFIIFLRQIMKFKSKLLL